MTLGQSVAAPGTGRHAAMRAPGRQEAKRERIVQVAMEQFAASGYEGAKVDAIAAASGVSKGAIFGYFGSKAGLFLAAYQKAASSFSRYLDAPDTVLAHGFFAVIAYWLEHTPTLIHQGWVPYRVTLLGNYCSELGLRRSITNYLQLEDPYGTAAFVQFGIDRGEVRTDIDAAMIVSLVDWLMDRLQDEIVTEERNPGLFGRGAAGQLRELRVHQFVELLRGAVAADRNSAPDKEPVRG